MAGKKTVEQRFPTKAARAQADAAIDHLPATEPMTTYLDTWLATYRKCGGIEK
jgi:hypothetical protein